MMLNFVMCRSNIPAVKAGVLRHVNMKFKVGSRLAVVGNVSGKTNLHKAVVSQYDPTEGNTAQRHQYSKISLR